MQQKWFDGIPIDKRKDWESYIRNSNALLDHLTKVFKREVESLEAPLDITDPSWPLQMSERQGVIKAYRNVLKMTNLGD